MKLIDQKGRLFGKFNIVDLIVLLLIVALVAAVVIKKTSPRLNVLTEENAPKEQYCYMTVVAQSVVPEAGEQFEKDMKAGEHPIANNEVTPAEIVSVKSNPATIVSPNAEGELVVTEHPIWKDVEVVVRQKVNPKNPIIKVANQEARVGIFIIVKTQKVELNAKIRGIEFRDE